MVVVGGGRRKWGDENNARKEAENVIPTISLRTTVVRLFIHRRSDFNRYVFSLNFVAPSVKKPGISCCPPFMSGADPNGSRLADAS